MGLIKKWWCYFIHPWKWVVSEHKLKTHLEQYESYLKGELSYEQLHMHNTLVRYCIECNKVIE